MARASAAVARTAWLAASAVVLAAVLSAAMVRRHIEVHTFASRSGESGVHLVDADSAPFGEFDNVQLAGLVDGEWPEKPQRNIF